MNERRFRIAFVVFSLSFLLTQFQNCAPAGGGSTATPSSNGVGLIDNFSKVAVEFPSAFIKIYYGASSLSIGGACSRDKEGQSMSIAVLVNGSRVANGVAQCSHGHFNYDISGVESWECGQDARVTAVLADGSSAVMFVNKLCQPVAMKSLGESSTDLGQPQECVLESLVDANNQALCQISCYSQQILNTSVKQDVSQCSGL